MTMKYLRLLVLFSALSSVSIANVDIPKPVVAIIQDSLLVVEGVVSVIKVVSIDKIQGRGEPLLKHQCRAIVKVDKTYKGHLTPDEAKSGNITVVFTRIDDARYKGDRTPPIKEGGRYFLFIKSFATSDIDHRVAILGTRNHIREAAEIAADATSKDALRPDK